MFNMVKNKKILFSAISLSVLMLLPVAVFSAPFDAGVRPVVNVGANDQILTTIVTRIISLIWEAFIAFAIIMFIVAGFQFLAAQGEPDGVGKAKKSVLWGVIGLIVGILAFLLPFIVRWWIFPL